MSRIILFNKPFRVMSQFSEAGERQTLADFIHQPGFYPAGRLDYDSEGLMVLTDDGALQHRISHPQQKLAKCYWVQVEGRPDEQTLDRLRSGIILNDGPCAPCMAKLIADPEPWERHPPIRERKEIPTQWLEIEITEGRNRQVRRMTAAIGHPTLRLIRVAIGPWRLGDLLPGESTQTTIHLSAPTRSSRPSREKSSGRNRRGQSRRTTRKDTQRRSSRRP